MDLGKLLLDLVAQLLALLKRASRRAGAFDMTPHQFIRVQVRRVAGQEVQGQSAVPCLSGCHTQPLDVVVRDFAA